MIYAGCGFEIRNVFASLESKTTIWIVSRQLKIVSRFYRVENTPPERITSPKRRLGTDFHAGELGYPAPNQTFNGSDSFKAGFIVLARPLL